MAYGVILADPPWDYDVSHRNGAAAKHYPTMSLEELQALPVAGMAKEDAVLLLWGTWPKLREAMELIPSWGFHYVTGIPWVKLVDPPRIDLWGEIHLIPAFGTGFWFRGSTELLLLAKRGRPRLPTEQWAGILGERMRHSRKPDSVYGYAETLEGPYVELFARRPREGWDQWGNEIASSVELEVPF